MEIVDPRVDPCLVPEGSRPVVIAENQPEYLDLPSIRTSNCQVITRWSPTEEERKRIADGEDIYLTIITPGQVQPVKMSVGPIDWKLCPLCGFDPTGDVAHDSWCPLGR